MPYDNERYMKVQERDLDLQKDSISEDRLFKLKKDAQEIVKEYNEKLDIMYIEKEERLLS